MGQSLQFQRRFQKDVGLLGGGRWEGNTEVKSNVNYHLQMKAQNKFEEKEQKVNCEKKSAATNRQKQKEMFVLPLMVGVVLTGDGYQK